jgi:hypothetical protein
MKVETMMRSLLTRKNRPIVTGNLGLFSIYFDGNDGKRIARPGFVTYLHGGDLEARVREHRTVVPLAAGKERGRACLPAPDGAEACIAKNAFL